MTKDEETELRRRLRDQIEHNDRLSDERDELARDLESLRTRYARAKRNQMQFNRSLELDLAASLHRDKLTRARHGAIPTEVDLPVWVALERLYLVVFDSSHAPGRYMLTDCGSDALANMTFFDLIAFSHAFEEGVG